MIVESKRPSVNQETSTKSVDTSSTVSIIRSLFTKRAIITTGVVLVLIIGSLVTILLIRQYALAKDARSNNALSDSVESLEYQTILPKGKPIGELGGWKRVSPDGSDPVFAFADKIGDTPISVSQQPLPQSFIGNVETKVAELAKTYNATTKIEAGVVTAYIGASSKGPQSVIFTKNSLLILIKSDQKIEDSAWAEYIKSLG